MSDTRVEDLAPAVASIEIDGPQPDEDEERPVEFDDDEGAPTDDPDETGEDTDTPQPQDAFEEALSGDVLDVTIHGPDATRGADAVRRVVKDALFDSDSFIEVPVMDGQATDRLRIALAGSIEYLASDSVGQKLFEGMTLGKSVDLQVEGTVVKKSGAWKMNADDEETVTGGVGIKIHSIYVLTPEEL